MRFFLVFVLLLVLATASAYVLLVLPFGPSRAQLVTIPPGSSVNQIARVLERNGIIRSRYAFDVVARVQRGTLKAGVYRFDHPAPLLSVYGRLRSGDVYTIALTIPEGYNIFDIAAAVEKAGLGNRDAFLTAEQQETELIRDIDPNATSLEGYLFPDTYRLAPNMVPRQILAQMVAHFRHETQALGLTENIPATVTMASLVERETPVSGDRPMVASVFVNRLAQNMPLDTDPSIIYAALLKKRYRGTIYASDLKAESPYNTYLHAGLPPGPICNPGIPSLRAAMHPASSSYLYFVSDPSNAGHSLFATTLEEHQKNVMAYRRGVKAAQMGSAATSQQPGVSPPTTLQPATPQAGAGR
ncbi:MAG: endolytic transglycosylase MltG [Acidobacteriaceae bacterium]